MGAPEESETHSIGGRCECGTVAYRVAGPFLYALNCHSSKCRVATGSAFKFEELPD